MMNRKVEGEARSSSSHVVQTTSFSGGKSRGLREKERKEKACGIWQVASNIDDHET